jgi:serine/threonine protein kinase
MSSDPFGLVGALIAGRYAVEAVVGEGGFSVVYRARHMLWNRPVAIKAFRGFEWAESETRDRLLKAFLQEGAILAELSERTTAIVQARDAATLVTPAGQWVPYTVLEWLEGDTLEAALWHERRVDFPPRTIHRAVALLDPVARALGLAHARFICHRDLKPGNIFVLGDPRAADCTVKLLDFGVAGFCSDAMRAHGHTSRSGPLSCERAGPGASAGFTPAYGAPEQFSEAHGVTGPWTDVFALALIVVELVCGREPMGDLAPDELARVATDPARRPTPRTLGVHVPDAVEQVLERALAVYPAERWQTAESFWDALREALGDAAADAPQPPPSQGERRAAAAAALVLALALAASSVSDHHFRPAADALPEPSLAATR